MNHQEMRRQILERKTIGLERHAQLHSAKADHAEERDGRYVQWIDSGEARDDEPPELKTPLLARRNVDMREHEAGKNEKQIDTEPSHGEKQGGRIKIDTPRLPPVVKHHPQRREEPQASQAGQVLRVGLHCLAPEQMAHPAMGEGAA